MKKIFIYILLIICTIHIYGQEKRLIIWNDKLVNKAVINIKDSISIIDSLRKHIINIEDNFFLVYYGKKIAKPYNYKFNYKPINVNICGSDDEGLNYQFEYFRMEDTLKHNDCDPIKDSLPDGLWMLVEKKHDTSFIIQFQKSVLNNYLHDLFIIKSDRNIILAITKYRNGCKVDTTFSYDFNGNLDYICYYSDICNEIKESITYDSSFIISYYNKWLGSELKFKTKDEIVKVILFNGGVKIYKRNNKLFKIKYYKV